MFKGIKDNFKKAEAAVIIENLLQTQIDSGVFETRLTVKNIANKMIQQAWDVKPDLLGGRFGTRPHKLSIALFAASVTVISTGNSKADSSSAFQEVCLIIFSNLINELEVNGRLYKLSETDNVVIELAVETVTPIMNKINSSSQGFDFIMQQLDESEYTWDEWYKAFVANASSVEGSGIVQDKNGLSLVDMMDHEPLKRAHQDGICPVKHGIYFAQQFDITKFGNG